MTGQTPRDLPSDEAMVSTNGKWVTVGEMKRKIAEEAQKRKITPQTLFMASVLREILGKEMGITGAEFIGIKEAVSDKMCERMVHRDRPFHLTRRYLSDMKFLFAIKVPGVKTRYAVSDKGVEFINHVFSHAAFDPLRDDGLVQVRPKTPEEEGLRRIDSEPMPTYDEYQS